MDWPKRDGEDEPKGLLPPNNPPVLKVEAPEDCNPQEDFIKLHYISTTIWICNDFPEHTHHTKTWKKIYYCRTK